LILSLTGIQNIMARTYIIVFLLFVLVACAPANLSKPTQAPLLDTSTAGSCTASVTSTPPASTTDVPDSTALLKELSALIERHKADFHAKAGWLHLVTRHRKPAEDEPSKETTGSAQYTDEEWLLFDEQGITKTAVLRTYNEGGQTLRNRILINGFWSELTSSIEILPNPVSSFDLSDSFYQSAARLVMSGQRLNKGILYQNCWFIGDKYSISDGKYSHEGVYNPDNGQLRSVASWEMSDGNIVLIDSVEVVQEERISQPPSDVLALLSQKSVP
jgi:hypothetical protein